MSDILSVEGRVALVTGAGQGVGRQIALHLASHGAKAVLVLDYHIERAQKTVDDIETAGGVGLAIPGDVTDLARMREIAATAREEYDGIDILVNNAGNMGVNPTEEVRKPFWDSGPDVWNQAIAVNFYGVINSTAAVLPGMIEQQYGRIVTIISEASRYGDPGLEVYAGAKAGAAGFTRAIARGQGRHGITANCVAIAMTATPAIEDRLHDDPAKLKRILQNYVIRRPGQPADVANVVLLLASDSSEYITGQTYAVNGGFVFGQ